MYPISTRNVSIIIPTLNAEAALHCCLTAIRNQIGGDAVEIIVADGGSTDSTLHVAASFGAKICHNTLETGEAGKAVGVQAASREILAFIDSDNILPEEDWLVRMIAPFQNPRIIGSEPISYTYRKQDPYLTRYCAMLGMNDPICLYLGTYDRYSDFTGNWTGLNIETRDFDDFLTITLAHPPLPTIGANGFLIRKPILEQLPQNDFLFDVDIPKALVEKFGPINIAKVKTGIVHIYGTNHRDFIRKQTRRIQDFFYYKHQRSNVGYMSINASIRILWFCLFSVLFLPNIVWAGLAYLKRKDKAVFYHPIACLLTLIIYASFSFRNLWDGSSQYGRKRWTQVEPR